MASNVDEVELEAIHILVVVLAVKEENLEVVDVKVGNLRICYVARLVGEDD